MSKAKRNTVFLLLVAGMLTLLLAMSLPNLTLSPGQPFSLGQADSDTPIGPSSGGDVFLHILRGFLALTLILLPVYILHSLVTREGRRRLLFMLILVALLFWFADYLRRHPLLEAFDPQPQGGEIQGDGSTSGGLNLPPAVFQAEPPSWLTLAVIGITSVVIVIVVFAVVGWLQQRIKADTTLEKLAETAQNTIDSLQAGGDFEATIIRCYLEMNRVVKTEKGITRQAAMTPREFEDVLMGKGLPQEAIQTLTRLFEHVRYGRLPTGTREEYLAVSCLTDIVNACGGQHEG
jgi:hypothetical protein